MKYLIINGSGASTDIEKTFPNGSKLVEKLKENWDVNGIIKKHNPPNINFLMTKIIDQNSNADLVNKVKAGIANIISEAQSKITKWNDNYFFNIIQKIGVDNVDQIDVINFNYDTVLENIAEYLINAYKSEKDIDEEHVQTRIKKLENLKMRLQNGHVYGFAQGNDAKNIDFAKPASKERAEEFMSKIKSAENIYFLGFGFDEVSLENIGFLNRDLKNYFAINRHLQNLNQKKIFITNYAEEADKSSAAIDTRRFLNKIMIALEEIFSCKIQVARDGHFCQGFEHDSQSTPHPIKLYVSGLSVGAAVKDDFIFF